MIPPNNFFLTFYHHQVCLALTWNSMFAVLRAEILMVSLSLYATMILVLFVCTIMLCSVFVIWDILTAYRNHRRK